MMTISHAPSGERERSIPYEIEDLLSGIKGLASVLVFAARGRLEAAEIEEIDQDGWFVRGLEEIETALHTKCEKISDLAFHPSPAAEKNGADDDAG
jgi:hypothetical protein